jgi:signal transduction histidine kinase
MPKETATRLAHLVGRLVGLAICIGLPAAAEIWRSYREATSVAERSVIGIARLLAEQTERTIQAIDFTLIGIRDVLRLAPGRPAGDPAIRAALEARLESIPYVRTLFVIGPDGLATHTARRPPTQYSSVADREFFQVHKENADIGLHIGRPLRSRPWDRWFVSLSRRIDNPDGSFGGVVVAAMEPAYLKRLYEELSSGNGRLIALLLRDGTLIARTPDHDENIGRTFTDSPVRLLALEHGSGVTWSTSPIDRTPRIVAYRTLAGGSLIALVGWTEGTIYDTWIEHAAVVAGGALLVWLLAAGLTWLWLKSRRRERLEQARLAQVQRLEMMGRIAGGIAHDLGNTIRIARTTFTLLRPSLAGRQDAMALVDDADRSLESAFDIIDRLLAFARRQELSPKPTDLADLISGFAPILRQAVCPEVDLDLDLAGPLVCVIDPIHLESALLNLVLNSKDAMPDGGRIAIVLRAAPPPRDRRRRGTGRHAEAARWAEIVVRDNGSGMSRDVQERAFEPFFTTRTGGSGLGLSQVLGFVQQSAGEIRIESQEGRGTTVTLRFPVQEAEISNQRSGFPKLTDW